MKDAVFKFFDEHQREIRMAGVALSSILSDPALSEDKKAAGRKAITAIYEGAANVKNIIDAAPDALPSGREARTIAKSLAVRAGVSLLTRLTGLR